MYIGVSVMEARKPISSDRSISSYKASDKEYLVSVKNYPMLYLMVRPNRTKSWFIDTCLLLTQKINVYRLACIQTYRSLVPVKFGVTMKSY